MPDADPAWAGEARRALVARRGAGGETDLLPALREDGEGGPLAGEAGDHADAGAAAAAQARGEFETLGGMEDAFPIERFEDREEAEMFWQRCPECVKSDDPDAY